MIGLGLPTLNALMPLAVSSMATMAPQPGRMPACVGQFGSRFVAMSLAPARTIRRAASTISKFNVRPSPDDDVIGVLIDDGVAVAVQGREQAAFADDERRAVGFLLGEKPGRRHRTGEDVLLLDLDPEPAELGGHVAPRPLAVVRQEPEGHVARHAIRG